VALVCWLVEELMILSIGLGSLLFGLCIYVFGCELIVSDPKPFNNCNLRFISQKKGKKVMLKKKKGKIKSCCEKKAKKKRNEKRK